MKHIMKAISLCAVVVLTACGGSKKGDGATLTDGREGNALHILMQKKNELMAKGIVAEVATADSRDLQTAINKVEVKARGQMGRALEAKAKSLQKSFVEEAGPEFIEHFSQTTKVVSSKVLNATTLIETPFEQNDKGYSVFGLMVMDPKAFSDAMKAELNANEAMKTRWLASKAYADLDKEVKNYEEFKANNKPAM